MGNVAAFLGLNLMDAMITLALINMSISMEANWYGFLPDKIPFWLAMILKVALAGLLSYVLVKNGKHRLFKPLNIGMLAIVAFNIAGFILYYYVSTG